MKKLKSNDDITLDRLSALPDSLINEILSFLDMRDVVKTTLLSKRWKYVWITIPCLQFSEWESNVVQLRNFVNRALMLWRGTYLRKFQITDAGSNFVDSDVNLWILFAKERKVEELIIYSLCPSQCLYECSSLRKLEIFYCCLKTDGNVQWDSLNSLELSHCNFLGDSINQIFSSSPQLETFKSYIECGDGNPVDNMNIRSSSLKKLSIHTCYDESSVLTLWAPNLEALEFSGGPYSKYLLTNVSSLTKVYLGLESDSSDAAVLEEALSQILPAIQHVVTVTLSADCFKMLGVMKDKNSVSPLSNVELLKIDSGLTEETELLVLLENFPNLKALIIVWKLGYDDYEKPFKIIDENYIISQANILKSNLLQLRTVKITWYKHHDSIFQFIEFLLKHAPVIEKMVIQMKCAHMKNMILAAQKVVSLQRSFPSVELILC